MADWSMTLRSGCSLLWRRGFESRFCQWRGRKSDTSTGRIQPFVHFRKGVNKILHYSNRSSKIINQKRGNLGSIRQDGRVVYGAAFRSQSPLEARVRIPLLSDNYQSEESNCSGNLAGMLPYKTSRYTSRQHPLVEIETSSKIINQKRENLGSIRQDGRLVYDAAFRLQSPLETRVRIPLLSGNTERNIGENFEHS
ncbi:unnamed protein product [Clavelina lepadiformis]|uniref:Uncharacterized protein n=1 Tax=Clavelina lepadiformis TaxID=159417 RepID=A0ABP0FYP6_CLALP